MHSTEVIGGQTYKTLRLAIIREVIFDANGGTVSEGTREVENGTKIGSLPTPSRTNYVFDGWFTTPGEGGEKITADTIITNDIAKIFFI